MTVGEKRKIDGRLERFRNKIDRIDGEILRLLNERATLAVEIASVKRKANLRFHSPERERAVLERLAALNKGPFPNDALQVIFREIMAASLSLEEPLKVAYFGPEGTFTHLAALRHFGSSARYIPVESIKAVFEAVQRGQAEYGLVPIENSNEGVVSYTLDMFMDYDLKIAAEEAMEISHHLLSISGDRPKIRKIYSHPQPVAQCREWLETNMPGVPVLEATSTAKAAELASKDPEAAAIASELASRLYGLKFVERSIEDNRFNFTRFLVVAKRYPSRSGTDKTSILFSLKNKPGALFEVLYPFKRSRINLTKIESRPSKRQAWEYIFFADLIGHIDEKKVSRVLEEVKDHCIYLKHLGSYPIGDKVER